MTKAAIITGATSGIGHALAGELASRGYALGLTGRRTGALEELERELGDRVQVETRTLDVTDTAQVQVAIPELAGALGGVSMVVANAGVSAARRVGDEGFEKDRQTIATNLIGAMATVEAAVALFREQGRGQIVGISSVAAFRGLPGNAAYCASKAGLSTYLEAVRVEVRKYGITVTTISPGFIDTPLNDMMPSRPFLITVEDGAKRIADLIESGVDHSTVPVFPWGAIGMLMRNVPDFLWKRAAR